jgi:hypothetical protein
MFNNSGIDFYAQIERRNDDLVLAEEYRRGSYLSGGRILIDELVKLLKSIKRMVPGQQHVRRHTPAPVSHTLELSYFHHFMHRNHKRHAGLQVAR